MIKKNGAAVTAPLLIVAVMLLLAISDLLITPKLAENENAYLVTVVIQVIVYILPCALYYQISSTRNLDPMLIRPVKPRHLLFVFFVMLMFISGNLFIKFIMYFITDGSTTGSSSGTAISTDYANYNSTFAFVAFVLIPSICEELFFRGVILNEYRKFGSFNAVLISALCFAMFHFSTENFIAYFFAGIVFGLVTVVCRSVIPAMVIHLINNILSIYTSDTFIKLMVQEAGLFFVGFVLFLLFAVFLLVVLSRTESIYYQYSDKPPEQELPPSSLKNAATVFLSPTFFLLLGVFLLMTFLN